MELCLITLTETAHVLARIAVCLIGLAALYAACFLFEDEEGKLQNRVEQLWITIDERRRTGQPLALATKSAGLINRALDTLLGRQPFSLRMVAMSICSSVAGFGLIVVFLGVQAYLVHFHWDSEPFLWVLNFPLGIAAIAFAIKKPAHRATTAILFVPFIYFYFSFVRMDSTLLKEMTPIIVISILSDILFILALRSTLRRLATRPTAISLTIAIASQIFIVSISSVIPYFASAYSIFGNKGYHLSWLSPDSTAGDILAGMFLFNISTLILSFSFIGLLAFLCLHRVGALFFWPVLSRACYPIARYRIATNRKLMASISIACFAAISPPFAELIKKASEWFK